MDTNKEKIKQIASTVVKNGGSTTLAQLEQSIDTNEKLDTILDAILALPPVEIPEPKETDLSKTNELLTEITEELKKKDDEEITYSISPDEQAKLKGDKGDSPSVEELLSLIEPLIPDAIPGDDGYTPVKGEDYFDGEDGSPDTGSDIIRKINETIDEQIDVSRIKNLPKEFVREVVRVEGGAHGGGYETPLVDSTGKAIPKNAQGAYVIPSSSGGGGFTYVNEIVSGSGTAFTLAHVPADSSKVALHGGGSRLTPGIGNDYTITGASITMTNAYSAGQVLADYS